MLTPVIIKKHIKGITFNSITLNSVKCSSFGGALFCVVVTHSQSNSFATNISIYILTPFPSFLVKNNANIQVCNIMSSLISKIILLFDDISFLIHPKKIGIIGDSHRFHFFSNVEIHVTSFLVSRQIVAVHFIFYPLFITILWPFICINSLQYPILSVCLPSSSS